MYTKDIRLDNFLSFNVLFFYRRKIISVESDILNSFYNEDLIRQLGNNIDMFIYYFLVGKTPTIHFIPGVTKNGTKINLIVRELNDDSIDKAVKEKNKNDVFKNHKLIGKTKINYNKIYKTLKKIQKNNELPDVELMNSKIFNYDVFNKKTLMYSLKNSKKIGSVDTYSSTNVMISDYLILLRSTRELKLRINIMKEIINQINDFFLQNLNEGYLKFSIDGSYLEKIEKATNEMFNEGVDFIKTIRFINGLDS